jgi:hypothetical protein
MEALRWTAVIAVTGACDGGYSDVSRCLYWRFESEGVMRGEADNRKTLPGSASSFCRETGYQSQF